MGSEGDVGDWKAATSKRGKYLKSQDHPVGHGPGDRRFPTSVPTVFARWSWATAKPSASGKAFGAVLVAVCLLAGPAPAQTLVDALTAAYRNNPELLSQRAALRATDEGVSQALANWRPTVELTGDVARSHTMNTSRTTKRDQIRSPRGAGIDVTQSLFRGFRTVAATAKAENEVRSAREALRAKEQDVLLDAVEAHAAVFRDQAVLRLNQNNEQVLRRQLEATRDRFRVGEITRTDVSQAEARLAGARADRIKAAGDLVKSRANYLNIVGLAPRRLVAPQGMGPLPATQDAAIAAAMRGHPDVRGAEFDWRAARNDVKSVKGELLPTLKLTGSLGRQFENTNNTNRTDTATLKLDLTVPLYQQGDVYSRLREAKQDAAKSYLDLEDKRRDSRETATNAWESLITARARIKSFRAQIKAAEIAHEGVRREASVGSRTVLDVLDAEQELLDANVNLVRAERDEVVASFELLEAVGKLTAKTLGLAVRVYDPGAHYRELRGRWVGSDSSGQTPRGAVKGKAP